MATTMKARETTYKGIAMRSRLEAGFAAWLDDRGITWQYEPRAFAGTAGQYLPDFQVSVNDRGKERVGYIEVKPGAPDTTEWISELVRYQEDLPNISYLARQMAVIFESDRDALPMLIWPGLEWGHGVTVLALRPLAQSERKIFVPMHMLRCASQALYLGVVEPVRPWGDEYWKVQ